MEISELRIEGKPLATSNDLEEGTCEAESGAQKLLQNPSKSAKNRRKKEKKKLKAREEVVKERKSDEPLLEADLGESSTNERTSDSGTKSDKAKISKESAHPGSCGEQNMHLRSESVNTLAEGFPSPVGNILKVFCNHNRNCPKQVIGDGSPVSFKCGRCHVPRYCSKECQVAAWPKHKAECCVFLRVKNKYIGGGGEATLKAFEERRDREQALRDDLYKQWETERDVFFDITQKRVVGNLDVESEAEVADMEEKALKRTEELSKSMSEHEKTLAATLQRKAEFEASKASLEAFAVAGRVIDKFYKRLVEGNKFRLRKLGNLLYKIHNERGAIIMDFESMEAMKEVTKCSIRAEGGDRGYQGCRVSHSLECVSFALPRRAGRRFEDIELSHFSGS